MRTSSNFYKAKFGELPFYEVGCIGDNGRMADPLSAPSDHTFDAL
jgi:hypothetical protein